MKFIPTLSLVVLTTAAMSLAVAQPSVSFKQSVSAAAQAKDLLKPSTLPLHPPVNRFGKQLPRTSPFIQPRASRK
jgi:hypothetical protein